MPEQECVEGKRFRYYEELTAVCASSQLLVVWASADSRPTMRSMSTPNFASPFFSLSTVGCVPRMTIVSRASKPMDNVGSQHPA